MKNLSKTSMVLIAAGLYLALGGLAGYATINAILLLWLGIERYRFDRSRLAIALIAISAIILVASNMGLVLVVILISLGIYFLKAKPPAKGNYVSRHRPILNLRLDQPSWVMHSMGYWHLFGEVRMDLSRAVPEEKETTIVLQGLVGDIDLIVPEDYGLQIEANVLAGQVAWNGKHENGMMNRIAWRSPDYDRQEYQVKLQLFYLVGNIKIRPI
ncbi:cell wall-active antibiotics response protein LiaF [Cohnella nanjingensis]|uniref:Cell wall-active antibiotics response protein n=1 Tax=Cohnella nanjingensis TaxID=1387779 RepID=A0A7X0RWI5_9BACL|nr:cell wall-active antibiotics response protein LiaF [Cohnella nanjingensis]MBB6674984.1 cell wall-active antibiotics response protein [Cohnella nanjingensis]